MTNVGVVSGGGIQGVVNPAFGAIYMDNAGSIYASENTTGNIYKIANPHLGNTTSTLFSTGPSASINDGARCPNQAVSVPPTVGISGPANVTTTNTNPPVSGTATPGASVTVSGPNGQACITTTDASGNLTCTSLTFTVGSQTVTAVASTTAGISPVATSSFTVVAPAPAFNFNCANATSSGAFLANGTAGQTGTLNLPVTVTAPGAVTLLVSGTGFLSSPVPYATTLTVGQTSISVPITYDGTGTAGTRTLTVSSASATGTCSPMVVVSVLDIPCTPVQPGIASASAASIQTGQVPSFSLSQYAPALAACQTWTIVPSAGVSQASGTGISTGNITS